MFAEIGGKIRYNTLTMKQDVRNRVQAMLANLSVEVLAAKSMVFSWKDMEEEE